jgi:hypothetical protein
MTCFRAVGAVYLVVMCVALSGCAWKKAGATREEFMATTSACQNEALEAYPVTLQDVEYPAYAVAGDTHCTTTTEKDNRTTTECKSDAPTLYPARTETRDIYTYTRPVAVANCMTAHGWERGLCSFPSCKEWKWERGR